MNEDKINKSSNRTVMISIVAGIAAILIIAIICAIIYARSGSSEQRLQEQLDLGHRYLSELNYEKAIAAFEAVIEIDPKNVEAYMGIIDAYMQMDDLNNALIYAEKAYAATGDESFLDKKSEITGHNSGDDLQTEGMNSDYIPEAGVDNTENEDSSYRALADDMWRLMDFPLLGKTVPAWRRDNTREYIIQNMVDNGEGLLTIDDQYCVTLVSNDIMTEFENRTYLNSRGDSEFYIDFYQFEYDEISMTMYNPGSDILAQYPLFGKNIRSYLEDFGLGEALNEAMNNGSVKIALEEGDTITIDERSIMLMRNVKHEGTWCMEMVGLYFGNDPEGNIEHVEWALSKGTEKYYG